MKNLLLLIAVLFQIQLIAQTIEIRLEDDPDETDISGTVLNINLQADETELCPRFNIVNTSDFSFNMRLERIEIEEREGAESYVVFAVDFIGAAYPTFMIDLNHPFISPHQFELPPFTNGFFQECLVDTGEGSGANHYRYYIINADDERLDSIDILYDTNAPLGIEEISNISKPGKRSVNSYNL